jgi:hypothetical protein
VVKPYDGPLYRESSWEYASQFRSNGSRWVSGPLDTKRLRELLDTPGTTFLIGIDALRSYYITVNSDPLALVRICGALGWKRAWGCPLLRQKREAETERCLRSIEAACIGALGTLWEINQAPKKASGDLFFAALSNSPRREALRNLRGDANECWEILNQLGHTDRWIDDQLNRRYAAARSWVLGHTSEQPVAQLVDAERLAA